MIASARTRTLLAVTIRSHRLHISIALHCALIGPIACADKSSDTQAASLTDASAAGGTTTAFDPTTTNTAQGGDERAHEVVTLHRDGVSVRAIARSLGLGRNTVRRLLAVHDEQRQEGAPLIKEKPASTRPTKLDTHKDAIARLIERYPDITSQRVFEELRKGGYDGGYTMVRERVAVLRPTAPKISLPTPNYGPGEMAENDWSPYMIDFATLPSAGERLQGFEKIRVILLRAVNPQGSSPSTRHSPRRCR